MMIPNNLITYVLIIVAAVVAYLIYRKRARVQLYFDNEIDKIQDLNYTDTEIELYVHKHWDPNSEDLINLLKTGHITEKERRAIQKILNERQGMPPFPNS